MRTKLTILFMLVSGVAHAADPPDTHYTDGVKAFQDANYNLAVVELRASLAAHPNPKAALYLGNAYLKIGRLGQAKDALKTAIRLDPKNPKKESILTLIRSIEARSIGKVVVTSTPPGATVYIDSEGAGPRGKTPAEITLPAGAHKVIIALEGYETEIRDAEPKGGDAITVDLPLRVKGCDLSVTADPPESQAALDGADPVPLPAKLRIAVGEHKVVISDAGFASKELRATCDGAHPVTLQGSLRANGRLKIPTEPGTIVSIDGTVVPVSAADAAAGIGLSPGRHEVTITVGNRPPYTTTVEIASGTESPAPPPPREDQAADKGVVGTAPRRPGFGSPAVYVGVEGGGNVVLRDWNLGSNAFIAQDGTHGVHPGSSGTGGVRIGVQVVPRVALEAEIHWMGLPNPIDTSQGMAYALNVPIHLLPGDWTPLVEGGAGVYQVLSGKLGSAIEPRGHLGLGLRGRLTDALSLRAAVRDVVARGFNGGLANNIEAFAGLEFYVWEKRRQ